MRAKPVSVGLSFILLAALACSSITVDTGGGTAPMPGTLATVSASNAASTSSAPDPNCTNRVEFVTDVTVPDGTEYKPGALFTKTWRLRNAGTCNWTPAYSLVFFQGEQMGAPEKILFTEPVAPGEISDFSVNMTAPSAPGQYRGDWKLMNETGVKFGFGKDFAEPIFVLIKVGASAAANPGGQTGQNGNKVQGGNNPAAGCGPQNPCACIPAELKEVNGNLDAFQEKYQKAWKTVPAVDDPEPGDIAGVDYSFIDFQNIYDEIIANGVEIRYEATYVDQNGVMQTYSSPVTCAEHGGFNTMTCRPEQIFPGQTSFPDPNIHQEVSIKLYSHGQACWEVKGSFMNHCIDDDVDFVELPECAGGMGGGPGLVTVTPTLPGYQCSPGYHWCGEGTACCPNGMQCKYLHGNLYCQ